MSQRYRLKITLILLLSGAGCLGCAKSGSIPSSSSSAVVSSKEGELVSMVDKALASGRKIGKYGSITSGDLLALALQRGRGELPSDLWEVPGWDLDDLRGTAQFGPWGMTLDMARSAYGSEYGIDPRWTEQQVAQYLLERPVVQAQLAAERLQRLYSDFGPRSPYALQSWTLPTFPPNREDWRESVARLQSDPHPCAREVLTGNQSNPRGILYWLAREGDEVAIRAALRAWRSPSIYLWEYGQIAPRRTTERIDTFVRPSELLPMRPYQKEYATVNRLISEVMASP